MATDPTPPITPAVTHDIACMRCRYLLRGLEPSGACPECGLPILASIEEVIRRRQRQSLLREIFEGSTRVAVRRPIHPPMEQVRPGLLWTLAVGAALLAAAHAGMFLWVGRYSLGLDWKTDPEWLLLGVACVYLAGAWLVTWGGTRSRRRQAVGG